MFINNHSLKLSAKIHSASNIAEDVELYWTDIGYFVGINGSIHVSKMPLFDTYEDKDESELKGLLEPIVNDLQNSLVLLKPYMDRLSNSLCQEIKSWGRPLDYAVKDNFLLHDNHVTKLKTIIVDDETFYLITNSCQGYVIISQKLYYDQYPPHPLWAEFYAFQPTLHDTITNLSRGVDGLINSFVKEFGLKNGDVSKWPARFIELYKELVSEFGISTLRDLKYYQQKLTAFYKGKCSLKYNGGEVGSIGLIFSKGSYQLGLDCGDGMDYLPMSAFDNLEFNEVVK